MKRGMIIGLVAGALVLVLVWYFALYAPTSKDIDSAKAKTAAAEQEQDSLKTTLHRLQDLAKTAPQQQAALRTLDAAVPETPDLADFIIQANDIARRSGIEFLSIAPAPPSAGTTAAAGAAPATINLSITIQGGFFQVLDYLKQLEQLDRLVIVDTLNLGSGSGGSSSGTGASAVASSSSTNGTGSLSVSLTGRMFTRAPASAAPGSSSGTSGSGGATTTPTTPSGSGSSTPTTPTTSAKPGSGAS